MLCFTNWNLEVQGLSDTSFSPRGQLPPQLPFNVQAGLAQVDGQLLPASLLASSVLSGFPLAAQAGGCCIPPRLQICPCKELEKWRLKEECAQCKEICACHLLLLAVADSGLDVSCCDTDSQLHGEQESKGGGKEL